MIRSSLSLLKALLITTAILTSNSLYSDFSSPGNDPQGGFRSALIDNKTPYIVNTAFEYTDKTWKNSPNPFHPNTWNHERGAGNNTFLGAKGFSFSIQLTNAKSGEKLTATSHSMNGTGFDENGTRLLYKFKGLINDTAWWRLSNGNTLNAEIKAEESYKPMEITLKTKRP